MCRNCNNDDRRPDRNVDNVFIRANRVFVLGEEDRRHCRRDNDVAGIRDNNRRHCRRDNDVAGIGDNNRRHCRRCCCWF
ncbi:hypothetical protein ACFFHH_04085 [Cytobacillus solani]|uniref:hypothetical protein n=1 Tax=Cytobacillus solani TaxID=1637975 RepID=UPI000B025E18|nr:hypothetical protein [Cytobacillus solani]USK55780.1 hypothetical protein LIS82_04415 [Cytobacillus solani]